jgi:hypothetical protein
MKSETVGEQNGLSVQHYAIKKQPLTVRIIPQVEHDNGDCDDRYPYSDEPCICARMQAKKIIILADDRYIDY